MSREVSEQTREVCELYRRALRLKTPAGKVVGELAAMFDVQRPAIYKALRRGGVLPAYAPRVYGGKGRPRGGGIAGYTEDRRRASEAFHGQRQASLQGVRVDRDPCPRCGVRGDIGCGHSRAPLGTML